MCATLNAPESFLILSPSTTEFTRQTPHGVYSPEAHVAEREGRCDYSGRHSKFLKTRIVNFRREQYLKNITSKLGTLRRRQADSSRVCAEPHRKIGERSLEILESAIDREDLLVDCAPLRDGGGIDDLARTAAASSPRNDSTQVVNTIHLAHFSPNIKRYKLKRKLKAAVFAIIAEHRFLASIARANPARYATEAARVAKKHSSSVFSPLGELANANGDK